MTEQSSPLPGTPAVACTKPRRPLRRALFVVAAAAAVGVAAGAAAALVLRSSPSASAPIGGPAAVWAAGSRVAPAFSLHDQNGRPVSLASLRGRTAIVTFIDPLCRNYCPLEAKVLNTVVDRLPASQRPAIVAVSVNLWGNAPRNLRLDAQKWHLVPEWRWAIGSGAKLTTAWRNYQIGVQDHKTTTAGVTVHEISHIEASYVIDRSGHERALFMWPFDAREVERTIASLQGA